MLSRFIAARAISGLGDGMLPVVLTAAILAEGGSAADIGLVLGASLVPIVLLMPIIGGIADKIGPLPLMIGGDIARVVVQGGLGLGLLATDVPTWVIALSQLLYGVATAAYEPGMVSLVPAMTNDIERGNSSVQLTRAITGIIGPAAGGLLLIVTSADHLLLFDAATFLLSGLLMMTIRVERHGAPESVPLVRSLTVGWNEFRSRTWLVVVIGVFASFGLFVFGPHFVLGAALITGDFGAREYGIVVAASGFGAALGGFLIRYLKPRYPVRLGVMALSLVALPIFALGLGAPLSIVVATSLIGGFGRTVWTVLWVSAQQSNIPAAVLNRVYSFDVMGSIALLPLGRAVSGYAGDYFGISTVLIVSALICVAGCSAMLMFPSVRNLKQGTVHLDRGRIKV